jgi:DNA-binding response OmpR family regulator
MTSSRHVIVVHHAPLIVEALDMALSLKGYAVHPAATFRDARALLSALGDGLVAVIAHADMPNQPQAGSLLRLVRKSHPSAALVVLSARGKSELGRLPGKSVLLREPFDRAELLGAIMTASSLIETTHATDGAAMR